MLYGGPSAYGGPVTPRLPHAELKAIQRVGSANGPAPPPRSSDGRPPLALQRYLRALLSRYRFAEVWTPFSSSSPAPPDCPDPRHPTHKCDWKTRCVRSPGEEAAVLISCA